MPEISRGRLVTVLGQGDDAREGLISPTDHSAFKQNGKLTVEDGDLPNTVLIKSTTEGSTDVMIESATGVSVATDYDQNKIIVTNTAPDQTVTVTAGTGISATGTYPDFTITNTAPDQTVVLTAGPGITITGTYPNFTISLT